MRFKTENLRQEYKELHREVVALLIELEEYSKQKGYPEPMLTHVLRTRAQQKEIYWRAEQARNRKMNEADAREAAGKRFTWHFHLCAADLRSSHYTPEQLHDVVAFLKARGTGPSWEVLHHDVGSGDHLHVGFKDNVWAKKHPVRE